MYGHPVTIDTLKLDSFVSKIRTTGEPLGIMRDLSEAGRLGMLQIYHETLLAGRRSSSPHYHTKREEFVYVLSGNPSVWLNGEVRRLSPHEAVAFMPGDKVFHMILNESDHPALLLVLSNNAEGDKVIYHSEV
jgi:uncharacterized cupin superfamily protein